ncbi:MAG: MarR family winged helix-turn-helix transcriptional regulator [Mycobacteriales bacterium]
MLRRPRRPLRSVLSAGTAVLAIYHAAMQVERVAGAATPSVSELAVWRTFLRTHAEVSRRLEAELTAEHELPLAWYDVLVQLVEAPDRRLRMTELADRVLLSRSGLTRLVDRLEREGLVTRVACPSDARGLFTVLTDAGRARLRDASPTHLRGIAEHMTGRFSAAELEILGDLLVRLLPPAAATVTDGPPSRR